MTDTGQNTGTEQNKDIVRDYIERLFTKGDLTAVDGCLAEGYVDAAFFATVDPVTLLFTGAVAEDALMAATPLFLANEFGRADVNKLAALAAPPPADHRPAAHLRAHGPGAPDRGVRQDRRPQPP
jgi:hypothetical protein